MTGRRLRNEGEQVASEGLGGSLRAQTGLYSERLAPPDSSSASIPSGFVRGSGASSRQLAATSESLGRRAVRLARRARRWRRSFGVSTLSGAWRVYCAECSTISSATATHDTRAAHSSSSNLHPRRPIAHPLTATTLCCCHPSRSKIHSGTT